MVLFGMCAGRVRVFYFKRGVFDFCICGDGNIEIPGLTVDKKSEGNKNNVLLKKKDNNRSRKTQDGA